MGVGEAGLAECVGVGVAEERLAFRRRQRVVLPDTPIIRRGAFVVKRDAVAQAEVLGTEHPQRSAADFVRLARREPSLR